MTDCGDRTVEGPWWGRPGFVRWVGLMALVVVVAIELPMWFRGPPVQAAFGLIVLGAFVILIALALAVSVGRRWWARWWAMRHGFAFSHRPHRSEPPRGVESFDNWQMLTFVHYSATGQISDRSARLLFYRNWFGARWRYAHRHVFTVTLPTALPGLTIGPNLHTRTRGEHIIFDDDDRSDFARYLPVFSPAPDVARRVLTRSVRDRLGDLAARSSVVRITVFVVVGDKLYAVWLNTSQPQDLMDVAEGLRILVAALEANSKL